jgi:sarcosine oxidase / L-pipecolate oxidase
MHVVVVGAGVFGLGAAVALARRGHTVTVLDRYGVPSPHGASVDSSRLVRADYGPDGFFTDLALRAIAGWHDWNVAAAAAGFPLLYHAAGVLFLRDGCVDDGYEGASLAQMAARNMLVRRLGGVDVPPTRAVPGWAGADPDAYSDGYLQPYAGWANARATVEYMAHVARGLGVRLVTGDDAGRVVAYLPSAGAVGGVRTADGLAHVADRVVVAAGPWSPALVPELDGLIQVVGQPVVYVAVPPALRPLFAEGAFPPFAADISREGWYGFPADPATQHRIKVGLHGSGFLYEAEADTEAGHAGRSPPRVVSMPAPPGRARPPATVVRQIKAFVDSRFPALRDQPVDEARLCYYCDSWDSYFYIDDVPGRPGLLVATGGSGHGFKFAPVLGDLIADAVEGRDNPDRAPFRWRRPPSRGTREAEACRMVRAAGPERLVLDDPVTLRPGKL